MGPTPPSDGDMPAMPMPQQETPAVHGMFMFGSDTVFLSHMPMFAMANHQYQVVLQVTLPPDAMNLYRAQKQQHPQAVLNLANPEDEFILPDLQTGTRTQFNASLWPDYTNDGGGTQIGDPFATNVPVHVDQIVHFRHFDPNATRPPNLEYLLFGTATEAHLSHLITSEPDFQHILTLATVPRWAGADQLSGGVELQMPVQSTPIRCVPPQTPPLTGVGSLDVVVQSQPSPVEVDLTGATLVWYSTGNLLNTTDPCAAPSGNGPAPADFTRDIAPLFRPKDIQHMGPDGQGIVDLTSAADVRDHIDDILHQLRTKKMPPPPDQPWTPEQIAKLEQWQTDNFPPIGSATHPPTP
jgi:hypothetical protein